MYYAAEKTLTSIRLSAELRAYIDASAAHSRITRTALIEYLLREALKAKGVDLAAWAALRKTP